MRRTLFIAFLLRQLTVVTVSSTRVGIIPNISLTLFGTNTTIANGTCEDCVCFLLANTSFFSLNCFHDNLTCELHAKLDQNKPFTLATGVKASFYFLALPTSMVSPATIVEYHWSFDSTFQDASSTFNGTPVNNASFSTSTITGYGSSLSITASLNQSVLFDQPILKLINESWTLDVWINLAAGMTGADYAILAQCEVETTDKCLHLLVRNQTLFLGFFNDDLCGTINLTASRWYHTAFVYDAVTRNQSLYLDGTLDASRTANSSYLGVSGNFSIGAVSLPAYCYFFNGLIDQLSFTNRTKTPDEILRDATLTLSVSFEGNSTFDEGPLGINGSLAGSTSFVLGRRGQALHIGNVSDSYFTVQGLVLLGRDNQPYSFSIWIKPAMQQNASIIHMSSLSNGTGWCVPMIGLTSTNQLVAISWDGALVKVSGPVVPTNSWTHVVSTYSPTHDLRLYTNGSLWNASVACSFNASGTPNHLFIGSPRAGINCGSLAGITGQYSGAVDELQVFSRELSSADILQLANPSP